MSNQNAEVVSVRIIPNTEGSPLPATLPGGEYHKARLEGLFVDELERFQPTPGYMRLLKESVLRVWHDRKASVKNEVASAEHRTESDPAET